MTDEAVLDETTTVEDYDFCCPICRVHGPEGECIGGDTHDVEREVSVVDPETGKETEETETVVEPELIDPSGRLAHEPVERLPVSDLVDKGNDTYVPITTTMDPNLALIERRQGLIAAAAAAYVDEPASLATEVQAILAGERD